MYNPEDSEQEHYTMVVCYGNVFVFMYLGIFEICTCIVWLYVLRITWIITKVL